MKGEALLGKMARDKVTGFTGIITCYAKHLYGCDSYILTPKVNKEGNSPDSHWFDEGRLEILPKGHVTKEEVKAPSGKKGGEVLPLP